MWTFIAGVIVGQVGLLLMLVFCHAARQADDNMLRGLEDGRDES